MQTDASCFRLLAFKVIYTLNTVCNSINIIMNCTYAAVSESSIMPYISNLFTFYKSAYYI